MADSESQRFSNIAGGIQSIVVSIAVVIGGIWTLVSLSLFGQIEKAKLELASLQKQLNEQAAIELTLSPTASCLPSDARPYAAIDVAMQNKGNRNVLLDISNSKLSIYPVELSDNNDLTLRLALSPKPAPTTAAAAQGADIGTVLRYGVTEHSQYFLRLPTTGLYWAAYEVPLSKTEQVVSDATLKTANQPSADIWLWSAGTFFVAKTCSG